MNKRTKNKRVNTIHSFALDFGASVIYRLQITHDTNFVPFAISMYLCVCGANVSISLISYLVWLFIKAKLIN